MLHVNIIMLQVKKKYIAHLHNIYVNKSHVNKEMLTYRHLTSFILHVGDKNVPPYMWHTGTQSFFVETTIYFVFDM